MQVTKLDVACAWSVAFILLHCGGRRATSDLLATFGPVMTRDQMVGALAAAVRMGVVARTPLGTFEAVKGRAADILQWHDWTDVGIGPEPDPREPLYSALLDGFVKHLNRGAPLDTQGIMEELRCVPVPSSHVKLKHREPPRNCFVYFIQMGGDGPIKIGWAYDPRKRLMDLQCASPFDLHMLFMAPGDAIEEGLLHGRFARGRLRGEWFRPTPELLALIASKPRRLYDTCTDRLGWTAPETWPPKVEGAVQDYLARTLKRLMAAS